MLACFIISSIIYFLSLLIVYIIMLSFNRGDSSVFILPVKITKTMQIWLYLMEVMFTFLKITHCLTACFVLLLFLKNMYHLLSNHRVHCHISTGITRQFDFWIIIMMKFVSLLIAAAAVINVASAFGIQRASGFRTSTLSANKLDGVLIKGDLSPLANNLLIKVKEAMVSTSGWQAKK